MPERVDDRGKAVYFRLFSGSKNPVSLVITFPLNKYFRSYAALELLLKGCPLPANGIIRKDLNRCIIKPIPLPDDLAHHA
jgi:hypothetical protein